MDKVLQDPVELNTNDFKVILENDGNFILRHEYNYYYHKDSSQDYTYFFELQGKYKITKIENEDYYFELNADKLLTDFMRDDPYEKRINFQLIKKGTKSGFEINNDDCMVLKNSFDRYEG